VSVRDPKAWMPQEMLDSDKNYFISLSPTDPHLAAALAWEAWAATLDAEPVVQSVSTGAQSATYSKGYSKYSNAMERATWHRSRAKIRSVAVGPKFEITGEFAVVEGFDVITVDEDGNRHREILTEHIDEWWEEVK
jgi:hypothetical protein